MFSNESIRMRDSGHNELVAEPCRCKEKRGDSIKPLISIFLTYGVNQLIKNMAKLAEEAVAKQYIPEPIEKELEALKEIVSKFESVDKQAQRRILAYMKSRFNDVFPYND